MVGSLLCGEQTWQICTSGCGHWDGAGELQLAPIDVISADSSPTGRFPCVKMSLSATLCDLGHKVILLIHSLERQRLLSKGVGPAQGQCSHFLSLDEKRAKKFNTHIYLLLVFESLGCSWFMFSVQSDRTKLLKRHKAEILTY